MEPVSIALALAQFAPSILRYFGAGEKSVAVAEQVVGIAKQVTGTATGPEAIEAMKLNAQLAHDFQMAVLKADGDLEQAFLADRKDARARDVALHQAGFRNHRADWMVALDVIGLIACLVAIVALRDTLSGEAITLITTLASYFGLSLRDAHQFEFGTSRGSKDKDGILANLIGAKLPGT